MMSRRTSFQYREYALMTNYGMYIRCKGLINIKCYLDTLLPHPSRCTAQTCSIDDGKVMFLTILWTEFIILSSINTNSETTLVIYITQTYRGISTLFFFLCYHTNNLYIRLVVTVSSHSSEITLVITYLAGYFVPISLSL